jgi:putative FmdB family regulatory protein
MPVYDYLCTDCGPFTDMRSMAECELPNDCPGCGLEAPRALLTAPRLATMDSRTRTARATNERSANAPYTLSSRKGSHGSGCSCCSTGMTNKKAKTSPSGAKSFPGQRPWMISH